MHCAANGISFGICNEVETVTISNDVRYANVRLMITDSEK